MIIYYNSSKFIKFCISGGITSILFELRSLLYKINYFILLIFIF